MSSFNREMDKNKQSYKSYLLQQDWHDLAKKITNLTKHYIAKVFFKANRFRACTCTYAESGSHD